MCAKVTLVGCREGSVMNEILSKSLQINGMYTHMWSNYNGRQRDTPLPTQSMTAQPSRWHLSSFKTEVGFGHSESPE